MFDERKCDVLFSSGRQLIRPMNDRENRMLHQDNGNSRRFWYENRLLFIIAFAQS
ncbi:hypothetical protein QSI_3370 [Clostridioides difficile P28]|nr:hypothetical protein QSI_3370 [Clostridioides difficile P28]